MPTAQESDEEDDDRDVHPPFPQSSHSSSAALTVSAALAKKSRPNWSPSDCELKWQKFGTLLIANPIKSIEPSSHIASFDLDSTLIETASGKVFAKDSSDWKLWDSKVPLKLRELHNDGYKIVIFSNQNGVGKGKITAAAVQGRVNRLVTACSNIPFQVLMATEEDEFRKPNTAMWKHFKVQMNQNVPIDMANSFYCGDAAGRKANIKSGTKKDFSCGDRKFALNCKLPFLTPDELFLQSPPVPFTWDGINPHELLEQLQTNPPNMPASFAVSHQEMIIMVGRPASGKSSFTKMYFEKFGYVRVNQDTLKTEARCVKAAEEALSNGQSVVIDNTNPSKQKRAVFRALCDTRGLPCRCFVMKTPREVCEHNNMLRERTKGVKHVPSIAYNMFQKNFQEPDLSEGFDEIVHVDFVPVFANAAEREEFLQFT
eukprot:c4353_g1_i1.p1 GENE.c4353_g1_i1~~c4353_g1_i1.p1  ORF type:complete len:429 (-),score=98.50 c4353_g1_i1:94-1380(-)